MFPPTLYGILFYICTYNARGCTFIYPVYVYAHVCIVERSRFPPVSPFQCSASGVLCPYGRTHKHISVFMHISSMYDTFNSAHIHRILTTTQAHTRSHKIRVLVAGHRRGGLGHGARLDQVEERSDHFIRPQRPAPHSTCPRTQLSCFAFPVLA